MTRPARWSLAILPGILACGIPLWPLAYREVSIGARPAPGTWIALAALAGVLAFRTLGHGFWRSVGAVLLGFALAVLARVVVETSADPTTHNLFPFEVAFAVAIALPGAVVGVGIPWWLARREAA